MSLYTKDYLYPPQNKFVSKILAKNTAWRPNPVILAFRKLRQEGHCIQNQPGLSGEFEEAISKQTVAYLTTPQ